MAVSDARVFPGFLTPVLTQISFQSYQLLFSHSSAEVRGENTLERNFASIGSRTQNHQVMSPTQLTIEPSGQGSPSSIGLIYTKDTEKLIARNCLTRMLLTLYPTILGLYNPKNAFENIMGIGENTGNHHFFFLFPPCFQPYQRQK